MATTIRVPDHLFSGFYYPEVLQALLQYTRVKTPELTSESEYEPHIQLLRAFSLVAHLNNTRVDIVANELLLDSAQLRASVRRLFKLIGYRLHSATAAVAEMLIKLSTVPNSDIAEFIPIYSQFSTEPEDGEDVVFESPVAVPLTRGDLVSHVFAQKYESGGLNGAVDTAYPQRLVAAGAGFVAGDVNKTILIAYSEHLNQGEYIISNVVDSNTVELSGASFVSETTLMWIMRSFSVDYETEANSDGVDWVPFSTINATNCLYFGHDNIQWDKFVIASGGDPSDLQGVWEYFDSSYSRAYPNSVQDLGGNIRLTINSLIGQLSGGVWLNRNTSVVEVTYNPTGRTESCISDYVSGSNIIDTKGLLGQSVVDTNPLNYSIRADWVPLQNQSDTTAGFENDGDVTFDLPMTVDRRWEKRELNGIEGYWLRWRSTLNSATNYPTLNRVHIDRGNQFVPFQIVQGSTVLQEVLGSSNGQSGQVFTTVSGPVFDDTWTLDVDETGGGGWVPWVPVSNLLNSGETDRHYKVDYNDLDKLVVTFGTGTNGRIPPIGVNNIRITYRVGGDVDGNVGAEKISGNTNGIQYVAALGNPMPSKGWTVKEGGTAEDLERAKEAGPASIRNQGKAVAPDDCPRVAKDEYRTPDGAALVARAYAIEEAFGPKTIELVVVGSGGGYLAQTELDDLETFFNGDRYAIPPVEGVLVLNHELTATNYIPKAVNVTVQVIGKGVTIAQIREALLAYLDPLAVNSADGSYIHEFGGRLAVVMLDCAIRDLSTSIKNIHRTLPAADVDLGPRELPVAGTLTITISESE